MAGQHSAVFAMHQPGSTRQGRHTAPLLDTLEAPQLGVLDPAKDRKAFLFRAASETPTSKEQLLGS